MAEADGSEPPPPPPVTAPPAEGENEEAVSEDGIDDAQDEIKEHARRGKRRKRRKRWKGEGAHVRAVARLIPQPLTVARCRSQD